MLISTFGYEEPGFCAPDEVMRLMTGFARGNCEALEVFMLRLTHRTHIAALVNYTYRDKYIDRQLINRQSSLWQRSCSNVRVKMDECNSCLCTQGQ